MNIYEKYQVIAALPTNSKNIKKAFISLFIVLLLCVGGIILSNIFWDRYTEWVYSFKLHRNIEVGWPATLNGWSWWMGIAIIIVLPFMYFMQDFKNPAIAITGQGLFLNQQMIRNTIVPFANIALIENTQFGYKILFKNPLELAKSQVFLFRPFVKYNLTKNNFYIYKTHTGGDIDAFMVQLKSKMGIN